jgi:hypothetical protein
MADGNSLQGSTETRSAMRPEQGKIGALQIVGGNRRNELASYHGRLQTTGALRFRVRGGDGRAAPRRSDGESCERLQSWNDVAPERTDVKPGRLAAD